MLVDLVATGSDGPLLERGLPHDTGPNFDIYTQRSCLGGRDCHGALADRGGAMAILRGRVSP